MIMGIKITIHSPHDEEGKGYEGSFRDHIDDSNAARRAGISRDDWENSASDRIADKAGAKRMRDEAPPEVHNSASYKSGVGAFKNPPKNAHGYGHPPSTRNGHLRNSGHPSAHRVGSKKK